MAALVVGSRCELRILFPDGEVAASLYVSQARVRDVNLDMMPYGVLNHEIDVWLDRFTEMISELVALKPFIERPGLIVVPDTSAFIEGVYFTELNWQELADVDPRKRVRPSWLHLPSGQPRSSSVAY